MQNNKNAALKGRKNKQQQKDHAVYRNRSPAKLRSYQENKKKKRRAAAAAKKAELLMHSTRVDDA